MKEFEPGRLVRLSPRVQRLVAPNPSMMTGPGTNTYLLGDPVVAAIDPGPADAAHLAVIRAAAPGLREIFVTHTHADHSTGAGPLAAQTGARLIGLPPPRDGRQDETFGPELQPVRDQLFPLGAAAGQGMLTLRAIDTPGHASNHVCYLLEEEGLLFSGDHVLDGVTPVILAPDGDMAAYLEALQRLMNYPLKAIAPAHGRVLSDPFAVIEGIIAHRLKREAKVLAALEHLGQASTTQLVIAVYDDVRPELHAIARLTLEAHLIKLAREGRCRRDGQLWRML